MNKYFLALVIAFASCGVFAQSGTNSPYSQYGLGVLSDQGNSFNRGMNGVGIALTSHNQVNYLNPASYSKTDSLSFIFDVGMSLQLTNFAEGNVKKNAKNADFEYAVAALRLAKKFGMGFGIIPFSKTGYSFSSKSDDNVSSFSGTGGVNEIFVGLGYEPIKGLSLGVNAGYLWGNLERSVIYSYSSSSASTLSKTASVDITNYKLSFGAQYSLSLNKADALTLGATYGMGHSLHSDPEMLITTLDPLTSVTNTTNFKAGDAISLPDQFGIGVAYLHGKKWTVSADYTLQKWSSAKYPKYIDNNGSDKGSYVASQDMYLDRNKIGIGGEYCQNIEGRSFASRIRYRFGASYSTPYIKMNTINGVQDGPKEISLSAGVGVPVVNGYNNRSFINVSAQWVRSTTSLIKENTFRINVGLTFNEKWFAKWKFE